MTSVPLAAKVAALRRPEAYGARAGPVEAVQTHMSWVFLAGTRAYKLKKPVRCGHLDFSTVGARHFYCLEELRLNRRLAPDVYLDVVPLVRRGGALRVGGPGTPVDWLVCMRRLPAAEMLDAMLGRGAATPAHMAAVARCLARFHAAQPAAAISKAAYRALLARQIDENERELAGCGAGSLRASRVKALCERQRRLLGAAARVFDARVAAGRVIEGHGDLRPEHVYLGETLAVIDCLEFSQELRTLDGADEIAYLAAECERAGAPALAAALIDAWRRESADAPAAGLLDFYASLRCAVRARLAAAHLRDRRYRTDAARWLARAAQYMGLARRHLRACRLTIPSSA